MAKKNTKKKEKAYYDKKNLAQSNNKKENKDLTKNRLFMLAVGFLVLYYSNHLAIFISQRLVALLGLGIMLYAIISSIKNPIEPIRQTKFGKYLDYAMAGIIVMVMLFNVFILIKHYM